MINKKTTKQCNTCMYVYTQCTLVINVNMYNVHAYVKYIVHVYVKYMCTWHSVTVILWYFSGKRKVEFLW